MPDADYDALFAEALDGYEKVAEIGGIVERCHKLLSEAIQRSQWSAERRATHAAIMRRDPPNPASLAFRAQWPKIDEIEQALSAWHLAGHRLTAAYAALPETTRRVRQPPAVAKTPVS